MLAPSADQFGSMCFASATAGSSVIAMEATSMRPSRKLPNDSVDMDEENRSVENTMLLPSGDHEGWRSAYASAVSERIALVRRSSTYKSLKPLRIAENAMCLPSGDQVGLKTWSR